MKFATKAIRVGQDPERTTGSVNVPIYQTANFAFDGIGKHRGYEYTRSGNPTRTALEQCLASLENGKHGMSFASGLAATDAVLSILRPGDRIISGDAIYGGTFRLFESIYRPRGIQIDYVDFNQPNALASAFARPAKMVWLETPTNPLLELVDIAAVADLAHRAGAKLVVDNTFASPYLQRPLELGADIVLHSTTKYIGGHSDVIGGAVITSDEELHQKIAFHQNAAGGVPAPFDCWLTLRGVKTLPLRMKAHCENSLRVAEFLAGHTLPTRVIYPGLKTHPQHALAKKQMNGGFGGIVTLDLPGGLAQADAFVRAMQIFIFAESLGGVESLACHPATMSHAGLSPEERKAAGISDGTIRLSVGVEDADDLSEDLRQALERCQHA